MSLDRYITRTEISKKLPLVKKVNYLPMILDILIISKFTQTYLPL